MDHESILRFWFGDNLDAPKQVAERCSLWFGCNPAFDEQIRQKFSDFPTLAAAGRLSDWRLAPRSSLALVLVLDQFPRNLHRGSPLAFAFDPLAVEIADTALANGFDRDLHPVEAAFFYMPLEHAEDLVLQTCAVELFRGLLERASTPLKKVIGGFLDYAVRHREVIRRFGRFPHRNQVLGRSSTAEETAYLESGGETFGSGSR